MDLIDGVSDVGLRWRSSKCGNASTAAGPYREGDWEPCVHCAQEDCIATVERVPSKWAENFADLIIGAAKQQTDAVREALGRINAGAKGRLLDKDQCTLCQAHCMPDEAWDEEHRCTSCQAGRREALLDAALSRRFRNEGGGHPVFPDRSDSDLLPSAVKQAGKWSSVSGARWSHVATLFGLGSTSATQLCRRFGVDPDEEVGGCEECFEAEEEERNLLDESVAVCEALGIDTDQADYHLPTVARETRERAEQAEAELRRLQQRNAGLKRAVRAALATWCPNDPGGDGADGETYRLALAELDGEGR